MPFSRYKKRSYKKRPIRRYKNRRYRRGGSSRMSKKGYAVYRYKRSGGTLYKTDVGLYIDNITEQGGVAGSNVFDLAFIPSKLPNFTDFTNLYDQYKVKALKVSFIPMCNVSTFTAGATGSTGGTGPVGSYSVRSYSALDFNYDATPAANVDAIREYQNMRWKPYNKIHSRYFYPRISSTDTASGYTPGGQPWLNITDNNRSHYGIIFGVDATNAPVGTVLYRIEVKAYLAFKCPK